MFDFSGTLLRIETTEQWLRGVLDEAGFSLGEPEINACVARLDAIGALPGGPRPTALPPHLERLWQRRDLTMADHRACYTALAREAGLPRAELAEALYERSCRPVAWRLYPDTTSTLRRLRRRGAGIAVVSNIGWDLRSVFAFHDLMPYIDTFVLSYEVGVKKPDPRIFETACDRLGLPPSAVLMVGDDRGADAGAAALGCPVHLVDPLPVHARPDALSPVLARIGDLGPTARKTAS